MPVGQCLARSNLQKWPTRRPPQTFTKYLTHPMSNPRRPQNGALLARRDLVSPPLTLVAVLVPTALYLLLPLVPTLV